MHFWYIVEEQYVNLTLHIFTNVDTVPRSAMCLIANFLYLSIGDVTSEQTK